MPEPPSLVVEVRVTVPERSAPGLPIVAVGAVLSTRTVIVAEVWELPALSVVRTRRSYWPSACSRRVPTRRLVRPAARADWRALELDSRDSRSTRIGGIARQADRAADVVTSAGAVIEPVGFVLSTRTVIIAEVWALPALSVVTTRRSYWPSACSVVFQLAAWFVHVPAPIGERWNWTVATPEPPRRRSCSSARSCCGRWRCPPER